MQHHLQLMEVRLTPHGHGNRPTAQPPKWASAGFIQLPDLLLEQQRYREGHQQGPAPHARSEATRRRETVKS